MRAIFQAYPDSFWSYIVLLSAMFNHFILFGTGMSFSLFFKVLMDYFETSRSTTAWFNSIQSGVFYFSGPLVSILLKRYDWRTILICGSILNGLGLSLTYFATSIYFLYITIGLLVGVGYGCMHVPAVVAVSAYFTDPSRRSFAQAISLAGGSLGTLIMPPLVYKIILKYGFRGAFLLLGGLMFQTIVFDCFFLPFPKTTPTMPNHRSPLNSPKSSPSTNAIRTTKTKDIDVLKEKDRKGGEDKSLELTDKEKRIDEDSGKLIDNYTEKSDDCPKILVTYQKDREAKDHYDTETETPNGSISKSQPLIPYSSTPNSPLTNLQQRSLSIESFAVAPDIEFKDIDDNGSITKRGIWRSSKFLLFVLMSACWTASIFIVMHLLFDFLVNDRKIRPAFNAAWIFSIIMISGMVGNVIAATFDFLFLKCSKFFSERLLRRRKSSANSPGMKAPTEKELVLENESLLKCWLFNLCTLVHGVLATLLFLTTTRYDFLCAISVCFGLAYGIKLALGPTICGELFGMDHLPFVYGYTMMASGVGILVSPPLGGYLVDITKSYNATFGLSALLSSISFLLYSYLLFREARIKSNYIRDRRERKEHLKQALFSEEPSSSSRPDYFDDTKKTSDNPYQETTMTT